MKANKNIFILILIISLFFLSNGGPVDTNGGIIGGQLQFIQKKEIKLEKEIINIDVNLELINVEVIYTLKNNGNDFNCDYIFPVKVTSNEYMEGFSYVSSLNFYDNNIKIDYTINESKIKSKEDNNIHCEVFKDIFYKINLNFKKEETKTLIIRYSLKPEFVDWADSKSLLTYYDEKLFQYDLKLSSNWGDGIVNDFIVNIDYEDLYKKNIELKYENYSYNKLSKTKYQLKKKKLKLSTAKSIKLTYDVRRYYYLQYYKKHNLNKYISKITSSSTLSNKYSPINLIDNNRNTAWVEGSKDFGQGDWIEIEFKIPVIIKSIRGYTGYVKNEDLYFENNRLKEYLIEYHNTDENIERYYKSFNVEIPYEDNVIFQEYTDTPYNKKPIKKIRFYIKDVYRGTKFNDTCISELFFVGDPVEKFKNTKSTNLKNIKVISNAGNKFDFDEYEKHILLKRKKEAKRIKIEYENDFSFENMMISILSFFILLIFISNIDYK